MTGDKSLFKTLKEKVGDYVTFGDGRVMLKFSAKGLSRYLDYLC